MPHPPLAATTAFISDIHGNLPALQAVLEDLDRRDVQKIVAAGDHVLGGNQPLEVWRLLQERQVACVRGLSDSALVKVHPDSLAPTSDDERRRARLFRDTRTALGDLVVQQLRRLPERLRIPLIDGREIVVVHGSPASPTAEISHDMEDDELRASLGDDPADLVVCGASHVAFRRDVDDVAIISVGSVGESPEGTHAHYTLLTPRMDGVEVAQESAAY